MTKLKLLSAGLIAAAIFATPAMASQGHATRHIVRHVDTSATSDSRYVDGRFCIPAPRVGAFATAPWGNDIPCEPGPSY